MPAAAFAPEITALDPLGGNGQVEVMPAGELAHLRTADRTAVPGVWRFVDAAGKRVANFAVNLDPREGNLEPASAELTTQCFGPDAARLDAGLRVTRDLLQGRYGRELWRPLLVVVLILLAVESLLARGKILT